MNRRAGHKTLLTVLAVGGLLACMVTWWARSEYASLRAQRQRNLDALVAEANASLRESATSLRRLLDELVLEQGAVPFYQYNNLYADPQSSVASSVTPSPLAQGPTSAFVVAHFQIDEAGDISMPTLNSKEASLSNPLLASAHIALREQLRPHVKTLGVPPPSTKIAVRARPNRRRIVPPAPVEAPAAAPPAIQPAIANAPTTNSYMASALVAQNALPTKVNNSPSDEEFLARLFEPQQRQQQYQLPVETVDNTANATDVYLEQRKSPPPRDQPSTVTVIVDPFEWTAVSLDGKALPSLVAVRSVTIPSGNLRQGFVVNQATIAAFLASEPFSPTLDVDAASSQAAVSQQLDLGNARPELAGWGLGLPLVPGVAGVAAGHAGRLRAMGWQVLAVALLAAAAALLAGFFVWQSERLAQQRSQFAATAAHELRTPLASLQLHGDLLAQGLGNPQKAALYAQRVSEEASRLGRVVANVLGYAQLEKNSLATKPRLDDIALAVSLVADRQREMLAHSGMALHLTAPPNLTAWFDRDALDRVLTNLIDNAEKYTRNTADRAVWIDVTGDTSNAQIAVRDNGPGMPQSYLARLFKPFLRGTNDGPAGLGLGLALSRALCRDMNGELAYSKAVPTGAQFTVSLASLSPIRTRR
ncbi:MAG: HAMP domain-containing histidine kinase [Myxococcales bacterium]|nr:HAMP domain-containing histidine kinase [Myxococcales bacterium]